MRQQVLQEKKFIVLTAIHLSELGFMGLIGLTGNKYHSGTCSFYLSCNSYLIIQRKQSYNHLII